MEDHTVEWFRNPVCTSWGWQLESHKLQGLICPNGGCLGISEPSTVEWYCEVCHSFGRCLVPNSHTWPAFGDAIWYTHLNILYVLEWNHLRGLQEGNHPKVQSGHWDWTTVSQADLNLASSIYIYLHLSTTLPETSSSPLKIDGWNTNRGPWLGTHEVCHTEVTS